MQFPLSVIELQLILAKFGRKLLQFLLKTFFRPLPNFGPKTSTNLEKTFSLFRCSFLGQKLLKFALTKDFSEQFLLFLWQDFDPESTTFLFKIAALYILKRK